VGVVIDRAKNLLAFAATFSPGIERMLSEPFCELCGDLLADHCMMDDGLICPLSGGHRDERTTPEAP
jgi:hypothetical protein